MMFPTVNPPAADPLDAEPLEAEPLDADVRRETTPLPVARLTGESTCSGNCPDCKRRAAEAGEGPR